MEKYDKTFKEIKKYRLKNTSLLHQFNILKDEENDTLLNIWKNYYISDEIKDNVDYISQYDVPENTWWENIAYEAYENENLWWIVAMTNDTINPFEELNSGETIKIIRDNLLYQIIKEVKNISEL